MPHPDAIPPDILEDQIQLRLRWLATRSRPWELDLQWSRFCHVWVLIAEEAAVWSMVAQLRSIGKVGSA